MLGTASWLTVAPLPEAFADAMDDDLGVPQALAVIHDTVRAGNSALDEGDHDGAARASIEVGRMVGILGINPLDPQWRASSDSPESAALDTLVQTHDRSARAGARRQGLGERRPRARRADRGRHRSGRHP